MAGPGNIKSSTKGAAIKKQGHTQSGAYGSSVTKKAGNPPREISPKG